MAGEEKEVNYALKGYLEEVQRLVTAYNDTLKEQKNFPEAQATIKENLIEIVGEIEQIDPAEVPVAAKNIIEGRETKAE